MSSKIACPSAVSKPTTIGTSSLREAVRSLLDSNRSPWVSLYMPVEPTRNRNRIHLRNLLGQLRDEFVHAGRPQLDLNSLLAPAETLLGESFQSDEKVEGLALFLTLQSDGDTLFELPFSPPMVGHVDQRVWVRPLWRGLEPDRSFYILSLWRGGVRLHRGSRYDIEVVPIREEATSLDAILQADPDIQAQLNRPESSSEAEGESPHPVIYSGQKDIREQAYVKEGLLRLFRRIDGRLRTRLSRESGSAPLVLAGPEVLRRLYRRAATYRHLLDEGVEDPIRRQGEKALHRRAWEIVYPMADQRRIDALNRFNTTSERTTSNPGAALLAAMGGRVGTLLVAEKAVVWGTFDETEHRAEIHSRRQVGDIELLNAATVETLRSGGTVYVTDESSIAGDSPVAALLRY